MEEITVTGKQPDWSWPDIDGVIGGLGSMVGGLGGFGGGSNWAQKLLNAYNLYGMVAGGPDQQQTGPMSIAPNFNLAPAGLANNAQAIGQLPPMEQTIGLQSGYNTPNSIEEALRNIERSKIGLQGFPKFFNPEVYANSGGRIGDLVSPELDRDTIPAMLTEDENVVTRRGVLGLDLMNGGNGNFTIGHQVVNNINDIGEQYLEQVIDRPLFNGVKNG